MSFSLMDIPTDEEPLSRGAHFGRYCLYMILAQAMGFLFLLAGLGKLYARARQIPPVVGFTAEHRPLTGKIAPLGMTSERFDVLVRDVVESALTRTQNGSAPELTGYLTPACARKLQIQMSGNKRQDQRDFVQVFTVDEKDGVRIVTGSAFEARAMVKGIMTSRSSDGVVSNRFYWGVQFFNFPTGPENRLGWRLNDIFEIKEKDFFAADLAATAAAAVKLSSEKTP
ncbi:MAG TPA: hypothetical protein VNV15_02945 [Opitutaceae bacterium]|jgi:hypothetical protein|nr:hypothetical protein [Opitutaceae bacterium]